MLVLNGAVSVTYNWEKVAEMEVLANTRNIKCCNMILTIRSRLENLEEATKKKMGELRLKLDEETNTRRTKETLLRMAMHQLLQEKERTTTLEKSVADAVSEGTQHTARIQKLESIEAELQATILEEQRLRNEAMQNVSQLQIQLQQMAMKLHEVEGKFVDMESRWVITPFTQSYVGKPRARSFSADQVLIQKSVEPFMSSHMSMDRGIKRRSSKQEKSSIIKQLGYSSPKMRSKMKRTRRSLGQICSVPVETIIESPPKTSTPEAEADNVFVDAPDESKITNDLPGSALEIPATSTVTAAVQEFENLSPRDTSKGAVPKRRIFQASKRRSLKMENETVTNKAPLRHTRSLGATWKPHHQSFAVPSLHVLLDVTKEANVGDRQSTKRGLSPSVSVGRVKKLRAEEIKSQQKSLLPRLKKQDIPQKLQQGSLRSVLLSATRREDALTIRRLATSRDGGRLLDAPVVEVFKFTPLHLAASWGHMESARALLDSGAGLEVQDWVNSTPLHIAAYWGHAKMCRLLLGRGAEIKARNSNDETPLHLAAKQGHLQVVRLLVDDWWADLDAKDCTGRTPWDVAQLWNKSLVANWLARQHAFKKRFGRQRRSHSLPCNTYSGE